MNFAVFSSFCAFLLKTKVLGYFWGFSAKRGQNRGCTFLTVKAVIYIQPQKSPQMRAFYSTTYIIRFILNVNVGQGLLYKLEPLSCLS